MEHNNSLMNLPLGTRFYVINGDWHGKIAGTEDNKMMFVEETGETHPLRPNDYYEIEIIDND